MLKIFTGMQLRVMNLRDQEGQTFAEYGLILAIVGILLIGALGLFRGDLAGVLDDVGNAINP
jgi:Flp pilus assembly pilin Flp